MMSNDQLPLIQDSYSINPTNPNPNSNPSKRKRSLPGTPDPDAEVIALSPNSLMATNRFICEICNKGFKRDQNLQLHRRGHNLPWKLKQRNSNEVLRKKVYICPETTCVHHDSSRALGDLTGIKKHYSRKHGEKKWKCDKCSKKYAVMSDWKAHAKICGTREYKCDCGTLFSRKDSFITHRAFCDALVEESARFTAPIPSTNLTNHQMMNHAGGLNTIQNGGNMSFSGVFGQEFGGLESSENQLNLEWQQKSRFPLWLDNAQLNGGGIGINPSSSSSSRANFIMTEELAQLASQNHQWVSRGQEESFVGGVLKEEDEGEENKRINLSDSISSSLYYSHIQQQTNSPAPMSATALLQKAAQIGSLNSFSRSRNNIDDGNNNLGKDQNSSLSLTQSKNLEGESSLTRDFLGVGGKENRDNFFASMSSAMEMRRYSRNE